jgi:hypothetical protein
LNSIVNAPGSHYERLQALVSYEIIDFASHKNYTKAPSIPSGRVVAHKAPHGRDAARSRGLDFGETLERRYWF